MNESQIKAVLRAFVHDLNGSLSANASFSRLILDEYGPQLDQRGLKWLSMMAHEYELSHTKLLRLAQYSQLLDFDMRYSACDLNDIIYHCHQPYTENISMSYTALPIIRSCNELLALYFSELLSNTDKHALRASDVSNVDQAKFTVYIDYYLENNQHYIIYRDDGAAISDEHIDYMQQPLTTLHDAEYPQYNAGFGFTILTRIAELLSGSLSVNVMTETISKSLPTALGNNGTGLQVMLCLPVR